MTNLLIVVPYFGGFKDGNPDVVDLAVELQKRGNAVYVLAASYNNDKLYEKDRGVSIFRAKPIYYYSGIDYSISFPFLRIRDLIKKFDIEIIHGVMEVGSQTLSALLLSALMRKPYILTIQGAAETFGASYIDAIVSIFDGSFAWTVSPLISKCIILSKNLLKRTRRMGIPAEKIEVIPSGIRYEEEFNPGFFDLTYVKKELGLEKKIVVGFSGRLVRLKGLIFLLYAQKILQKSIENLHLLVLGDGSERLLLESMSKKLKLNATFVGWVKRSRVPFFLSAVDIFVNPSLSEGLPIAIMEAMSMEKPVVATDVGGTADLLESGKNGFLVPPGEVEILANAIRTLVLSDNLRLTMGRFGRKIIKRCFSWDAIIPKIEKVYEEVLR